MTIVFVWSGQIVAYCTIGDFRFVNSVLIGEYFDKIFQNHHFLQIFPAYCISFCPIVAIDRYFVFSIDVISQCWLLRYLPLYDWVCASTSLSPCASLLLLTAIAINEVRENVFRRPDCIGHWYVALPAYDLSIVIIFAHITHNEIDWVIVRRASELFCRGLFSVLIDFVLSFVD